MTHYRGQIELGTDILKHTYFRVYTGCEWLDDFYTCDTLQDAERISKELQAKTIYPKQ